MLKSELLLPTLVQCHQTSSKTTLALVVMAAHSDMFGVFFFPLLNFNGRFSQSFSLGSFSRRYGGTYSQGEPDAADVDGVANCVVIRCASVSFRYNELAPPTTGGGRMLLKVGVCIY